MILKCLPYFYFTIDSCTHTTFVSNTEEVHVTYFEMNILYFQSYGIFEKKKNFHDLWIINYVFIYNNFPK